MAKTKKELEEATKRIRQLASEGKIEMAEQIEIERHPEFLDKFMRNVMCVLGYMVTDESYLSDFFNSKPNTPKRAEDYRLVHDRIVMQFEVDVPMKMLRGPIHAVVSYIARETEQN